LKMTAKTAAAAENFAEKIRALSVSDDALKQLQKEMPSYEKSLETFSDLDAILIALDPRLQSYGWAFLLSVRIKQQSLHHDVFIAQMQRFVEEANAHQLHLITDRFYNICRKLAEIVQQDNQPLRGIRILRIAIEKIQKNPTTLTPLHSDFVKLCLLGKCYNAATQVIETDILEIDSQLAPKDYLTYFYYAGMIAIGIKSFRRALDLFKLCLTAPAVVASAIMIDAYKKYILVSLLLNGSVETFPKYTSSIVGKLKGTLTQYFEFATAYSTNSTEDLHKCAQAHAETFQKDKNFGLIKQCIQSQDLKNIQRLTQTYITLSLSDISQSARIASSKIAELSILKMIDEGQIKATINEKDGMVSFGGDAESYDSGANLQSIDANIVAATSLARIVQNLEEQIATSQNYIQRSLMAERHMAAGSGGRIDFDDFIVSDSLASNDKSGGSRG